MDNEKVMCFPAKVLENLGVPAGYSKDVEKYFSGVLQQENIHFVDRQEAETNESWKQIIPYHLIKSNDSYFVYRRGSKGAEDRLHSKLSLGIGGHINQDDVGDDDLVYDVYKAGADREIDEEIQLPSFYYEKTLGVIYDISTDVGKVHFGFVEVIDVGLDKEDVKIVDEALDFVGWFTKDALVSFYKQFETWSQIIIDNFLEKINEN